MRGRLRDALRLIMTMLAVVLLLGQAAVADDDDTDDASPADKAAARLPQPVVVGSLIQRTVLEPIESQPILGNVKAIVKTRDGIVEAVIAYGGFFGFGQRPIAVPMEAMALLGEYVEIVDFTPAQLNGFPTFKATGTVPLPPSEVIKVGLAKPSH